MTETLNVPDLPENFRARVEEDPDPDTSYMDQPGFTHMRAIYESGEFSFVGVVLEHECECCSLWKVVGSLWGIEHSGTRDSLDYLVDTAMELFHEDQAQAEDDDVENGERGFPVSDPEREDFHADG